MTSLLNAGAGKKPIIRNNILEATFAPIDGPTPILASPEEIASSRRTSDARVPRNRTPWDAGGYSLPLSLSVDTKLPIPSAKPAFYSEYDVDQSTSASSYHPSSSNHSRASSLSSLAHEMAHSANITPMTSTHPGRYVVSSSKSSAVAVVCDFALSCRW